VLLGWKMYSRDVVVSEELDRGRYGAIGRSRREIGSVQCWWRYNVRELRLLVVTVVVVVTVGSSRQQPTMAAEQRSGSVRD
jgi:hypothetical protein